MKITKPKFSDADLSFDFGHNVKPVGDMNPPAKPKKPRPARMIRGSNGKWRPNHFATIGGS